MRPLSMNALGARTLNISDHSDIFTPRFLHCLIPFWTALLLPLAAVLTQVIAINHHEVAHDTYLMRTIFRRSGS